MLSRALTSKVRQDDGAGVCEVTRPIGNKGRDAYKYMNDYFIDIYDSLCVFSGA
jgi:hypothetical protein